MIEKLKLLILFKFLLVFSSCGGGGGFSGNPPSLVYDYTEGQSSSLSQANSSILLDTESSLPYDGPSGNSFSSLTQAHSSLNFGFTYPIATRDTGANTAWSNGWTGKDVKVGILDSFNSNSRIDSHGDWVSLVVNSVAPETNVLLSNLPSGDLSTTIQNANNAYDYYNTNEYFIVNNSWGFEKPLRNASGNYTGVNDSNWETTISNAVSTKISNINSNSEPVYNGKMLFVYAAGNGAQFCGSVLISDCDYFATLYKNVRLAGYEIGEDTLFVGSLNDAGTSMANYSYQAGEMLNDFIVAHDDVFYNGDASGTSFSSPRVVGAAALLRHKFPNLDGSALKQVLLQTASDLGATGVDRVYGHGKLNISNAMSPQGKVTVQ